jgi:hypothetical protein
MPPQRRRLPDPPRRHNRRPHHLVAQMSEWPMSGSSISHACFRSFRPVPCPWRPGWRYLFGHGVILHRAQESRCTSRSGRLDRYSPPSASPTRLSYGVPSSRRVTASSPRVKLTGEWRTHAPRRCSCRASSVQRTVLRHCRLCPTLSISIAMAGAGACPRLKLVVLLACLGLCVGQTPSPFIGHGT